MAYLFTYGTLQDERIQMALFKRTLQGHPDTLPGYDLSPQKVAGLYPVVFQSPNAANGLAGIVYEVTESDLKNADDYEGEDYQRTRVVLASGRAAWVYIGK